MGGVATNAAVLIVVSLVAGASAAPQRPRPLPTRSASSATRVISPTAVVSWFTERATDGADHLQLMVLWRGSPGWFAAPGGVRGSSDSTGAHRVTVTYGAVQLSLFFDASQQAISINDFPVDMRDANVILVDDVDAAGGPRVVGTRNVTSAMPGSAQQIGLLLRTSPELMAFLRCDATSSDPVKQRLLTLLSCVQTLGVAP